MQALIEDMRGSFILEPVFMVAEPSLCNTTHAISKCFLLVIFYGRISLLTKNLYLSLFVLCFTSYIAQARENALRDMKLI
jgi:hypothetical protein